MTDQFKVFMYTTLVFLVVGVGAIYAISRPEEKVADNNLSAIVLTEDSEVNEISDESSPFIVDEEKEDTPLVEEADVIIDDETIEIPISPVTAVEVVAEEAIELLTEEEVVWKSYTTNLLPTLYIEYPEAWEVSSIDTTSSYDGLFGKTVTISHGSTKLTIQANPVEPLSCGGTRGFSATGYSAGNGLSEFRSNSTYDYGFVPGCNTDTYLNGAASYDSNDIYQAIVGQELFDTNQVAVISNYVNITAQGVDTEEDLETIRKMINRSVLYTRANNL